MIPYFFKKILAGDINSLNLLVILGVSCRFSYSIVSYLYVSCIGSITSVGKRAIFSANVYLKLSGFC